jgi:hypothetical protein
MAVLGVKLAPFIHLWLAYHAFALAGDHIDVSLVKCFACTEKDKQSNKTESKTCLLILTAK